MADAKAHRNSTSDNAAGSAETWRKEAQITLNLIAKLTNKYRARASEVDKARKADPKAKAIREKQALRKVGHELRIAKNRFEDQVTTQAKRECRPLCEKMYAKLPSELRVMIYDSIIIEHNSTFYYGEKGRTAVANGTSPLMHCFNPSYTGKGMHKDIVGELGRIGSRFDFRGRHELLGKAFEQYVSNFDLDLASIIKKLSFVVTEHDLKTRKTMLGHLKNLFKLTSGAAIYIFIETGGGRQTQIARQFRRVLRVIFPLLERLKDAGYLINIVVNPPYFTSRVKNCSGSHFSVVPEARYWYGITPNNANFTPRGFEEKLKKCFEEYGEYWSYRADQPEL